MLGSIRAPRPLLALVLLWMASPNIQAGMITTIPDWNGSAAVSAFGYGDATATYGETITATLANNVLTSFTFEMKLPKSTTFRGHVYEWNGTMATGGERFVGSPDQNTTLDNTGFEAITFNTGAITLTPGLSYVLFASTTDTMQAGSGQGIWGQTQNQNSYADGEFVFIDNVSVEQWTSVNWTKNHLGIGADLAFEATFASRSSSVPEPTSLALVGVVMAGVVALRRRRK